MPSASVAQARQDTTLQLLSPPTASQHWATFLPPLPLHQHPPQSAGATLTWTASLTNPSHSDAPPGTCLEVTGQLKGAVEVIDLTAHRFDTDLTMHCLYVVNQIWHVRYKYGISNNPGGGSATASPQLKRRMVDTTSQPKFFLNLDRSKLTLHQFCSITIVVAFHL